MRKHLFILAILLLLAANLVAQNDKSTHRDSAFIRGITLEVNPTLVLTELTRTGMGEIGAYIHKPLNNNISIYLGGGYSSYENYVTKLIEGGGHGTYNSSESLVPGYTLRAGVCYFLDTKIYISVQLMYRKWGTLDSVNTYSGALDNGLLSPYSYLFPIQTTNGAYGNGPPYPYDVDNVTMTSYGIDVIFGHQTPLFKSKHFIFEYYLGAGVRLHSYSIEKIGRYDDYLNTAGQVEYKALPTPSYSNELTIYPDLKFGCMFGYKF